MSQKGVQTAPLHVEKEQQSGLTNGGKKQLMNETQMEIITSLCAHHRFYGFPAWFAMVIYSLSQCLQSTGRGILKCGRERHSV